MIFPGIDLGTTYSMIAHVNAYGHPALFPDLADANQFRTASAVYVGGRGCAIGAATDELLEESEDLQVARFVKALLTQPDYLYRDDLGRDWNAIGLSALILRKLLRDASVFSGETLGPAVITVPAQFTDEQRRATLAAAALAGLDQTRLVEEPVAAAVYYGQEEGAADRTIMVYDFGGGTFDVTLLQASPDGLFVLANDGDMGIGGRNLDEGLMALADAEFEARHGRSSLSDIPSRHRLRRLCEEAKLALTRPGVTSVRRAVLLAGQPHEIVVTSAALDGVVMPAVDRSLAACDRCLAAAGLDWRDLDKILLTGGSSLLPHVSRGLAARWGRPASELTLKQPHQAVAFGAALLANRYAGQTPTAARVVPVTGSDLSIRVWDEARGAPGLETLIPRNSPLPARGSRLVYTHRPDQTQVSLEFVQRRADGDAEVSLGQFSFGPILAPRLNYPVELEASCDEEGLVQVAARDQVTGQAMTRIMREADPLDAVLEVQRRLVASVDLGAF